MIQEKRYTLSELSAVLSEATKNEFKPVLGKGVAEDDKKNNGKAVDGIMKEVDKYNPNAEKRDAPSENTNDTNCTTLEYRYAAIDDSTRDRFKAQALGYPSEQNMKDSDADESGADFEGNKKFYNQRKEISDRREEDREANKAAGLKTREEIKKSKDKADAIKSKTAFGESKNMKRLHFKNTRFLSEAHMLKKVPDDYKYDGNRFIMRDADGTDYLVECSVDDEFKFVSFNVINKTNKKAINEQLDRMRSLFNYDRSDNASDTLRESRMNGDADFAQTMDIVRNLKENKQ